MSTSRYIRNFKAASGRAVTAAPAGGVNNRVIGIAMVSGVVGDIGQMIVSQGSVQG